MATLKAHGTEILRISKEGDGADGTMTDWSRVTYAVMEDRVMLKKRDVHFTFGARQNHSYGWKKMGKVKPEVDLAHYRDQMVKAGFKVEVDCL